MGDDPQQLRPADPEPDGDLVEALRELLEMAKSGELLGFALAGELTGREVVVAYSVANADEARLLGAIERLRVKMALRWGLPELDRLYARPEDLE